MTRALEIDEAVLGPDHPELAEALLELANLQLDEGRLEVASSHALRLRALRSVDVRRRARAAFILAQLDAAGRPPSSPRGWLAIAAEELEQSSESADSDFGLALRRWQRDWRAEARRLRARPAPSGG